MDACKCLIEKSYVDEWMNETCCIKFTIYHEVACKGLGGQTYSIFGVGSERFSVLFSFFCLRLLWPPGGQVRQSLMEADSEA